MIILRKLKDFFHGLLGLLLSAQFIIVSILGNTIVVIFSIIFYHLEHGVNGRVLSYIDAVWWAFSTITTVGYGDTTPVTFYGKILGIFLMLLGTAIFATYTALFAQLILRDQFWRLEQQERLSELRESQRFNMLKEVQQEIEQLKKDR